MLAKRTAVVIAGYNFLEELKHLNFLALNPKQPYMAIVGGSKISSKLLLVESFLAKVNRIFIGGAMATTFFIAQKRIKAGCSFYEKETLEVAELLSRSFPCKIMLPTTVVVKTENGEIVEKIVDDVLTTDVIMDIGEKGVNDWCEILKNAQTIIWNGPLGVYETPPFEEGTLLLAKNLASLTKSKDITTIIGGGDTLASVKGLKNEFSYASVSGGAFLEWLEGRELPGISALER
jgi:phosphoglycerate kinase